MCTCVQEQNCRSHGSLSPPRLSHSAPGQHGWKYRSCRELNFVSVRPFDVIGRHRHTMIFQRVVWCGVVCVWHPLSHSVDAAAAGVVVRVWRRVEPCGKFLKCSLPVLPQQFAESNFVPPDNSSARFALLSPFPRPNAAPSVNLWLPAFVFLVLLTSQYSSPQSRETGCRSYLLLCALRYCMHIFQKQARSPLISPHISCIHLESRDQEGWRRAAAALIFLLGTAFSHVLRAGYFQLHRCCECDALVTVPQRSERYLPPPPFRSKLNE